MVQYINVYIKEFWYSVVSEKLAFISYTFPLPIPIPFKVSEAKCKRIDKVLFV